MLISTIIPTIGRPSLDRAVDSVLSQRGMKLHEHEVIIVNDSGQPMEATSWHDRSNIRIIDTNRRRQIVARNAGAALARGEFLHFLDDDDYVSANAFATLKSLLTLIPGCVLYYGGIEFVDSTGNHLGSMNLGRSGNCLVQMVSGAWIQLGSAIIRTSTFFQVGGFNAQYACTEETELYQRLALVGDFCNTPYCTAYVRRGNGWQTSSQYELAVELLRDSRANVLSAQGSFSRMLRSAEDSYWTGRCLKSYLSTALWNMRTGSTADAISNLICGGLVAVRFGLKLSSKDFWLAIRDTQVPQTQHGVLDKLNEGTNW